MVGDNNHSSQDGVQLEESGGAWIDRMSGKRVHALSLSAERGLWSASDEHFRLSLSEMIGVHLDVDENCVKFAGYRSMTKTSWCLGSSQNLEPIVIEIVATGKESVEENKALAKSWYRFALQLLGRTEQDLDKPLLVFVNPVSGPGKAKQIWNTIGRKVICELGGHKAQVIVTEYAGHSSRFIREHNDLSGAYKGVVIVSGDGGVYEALQGIMARSDWAKCLECVPLGVLPGGSGNGLAKSTVDEMNMPFSAIACAFAIAKGRAKPLDICAVDVYNRDSASNRRFYSFLSFEWGLVADADIGSEYLRFLGELRFAVQAFVRLIFRRNYFGEISYLPESTSSNQEPRTPLKLDSPSMYWDVNKADHEEFPKTMLLPDLKDPVPSNWVREKGQFWQMWNCMVPWMTSTDCVSPDSRSSDGFIQLQWVKSHKMSRWQQLVYLLGLEKGQQIQNPLVNMAATRAYRFEPFPEKDKIKGTIALDGELIEYNKLQMENLRGLWKLFSTAP